LDKELDAFMGDSNGVPVAGVDAGAESSAGAAAATETSAAAQDVEMA
jgi:hypothetical protein